MDASAEREFVINPRTNRLMQKGGATHRQWQKSHPESPPLQIVHSTRKEPHVEGHIVPTPTDPEKSAERSKSRKRKRSTAAVEPTSTLRPLPHTVAPLRSTSVEETSNHPLMSATALEENSNHPLMSTVSELMLKRPLTSTDLGKNARHAQLLMPPMSPPLRRRSALDEEGLRSLTRDGEDPTTPEYDPDAMTDEVLHEHGPALFNAFQNPSVDFLEEAAKLLGLVNLRG